LSDSVWAKYGYTIASTYRTKIVSALLERPKTPKELAKELNLYLSHVSSTLSELLDKDIAYCINPSQRRGKVFTLTKEGKEVGKQLSQP
jgi:DNA-binding MarR family transcriptional regulator